MPRLLIVALAMFALIAASGVLVACGEAQKQDAEDADASVVNRDKPDFVIAMPDDYRNVVAKCDGRGHLILVTSHAEGQPSAVAAIDDPECGE